MTKKITDVIDGDEVPDAIARARIPDRLKKMSAAVQERLGLLITELDDVKAETWADLSAKGERAITQCSAYDKELLTYQTTVDEVAAKAKKVKNRAQNHERFLSTKNAKHFVAMGTAKGISNLASRACHSCTKDHPDNLAKSDAAEQLEDVQLLSQFKVGFPVAQLMNKILGDEWTTQQNALKETLNSLPGKGARGYYHVLNGADKLDQLDKAIVSCERVPVKPASFVKFPPFAVVVRSNTCRIGNQAIPFWGHALMVVARTPLAVTCVDLNKLVTKTTVTSLDKLDKIMEERIVVRMTWPVAHLLPDEVLFLPYGVLPFVAPTTDDFGMFAVVPFLGKEMTHNVSEEVQLLVESTFGKFIGTMNGKRPWPDIAKSLKELAQSE